jgi:hypothetical protein
MIPQLHLLNWGMGVESTAILVRWLLEPQSRPFNDFHNLIVLAAQTGDEMGETKSLCENYLFPLMRDHKVRLVQVAKASASKLDGYIILSDTHQPYELHIEGYFPLSRDLLQSGTVPRLGRPHICAQRWKGEVLDAWISDHITEAFGPYLGYNADETKRAGKADGYTCQGHQFLYPLIEWGWTRDDCTEYLYRTLRVLWRKSACSYCPFQQKQAAIARYDRDPKAAGFTLLMEMNALAFNPRMHLFSSGTAYDLMVKSSNQAALDELEQLLRQLQWAIYHVQRTYKQLIGKKGKPYVNSDRKVVLVDEGNKAQMESKLETICHRHHASIEDLHGKRCYLHRRQEGIYPAFEEFYVVAPKLAKNKCRNLEAFEQNWRELTEPAKPVQLTLFVL